MIRRAERDARSSPPLQGRRTDAQARGAWAEDLACRYLSRQGLALEKRNYRCRCGEIDLIMHDVDTLVFVEVRYRSRSDYGTPAESVNGAKQRRLVAAAERYLARRRRQVPRCRFDVVSITRSSGRARVEWIRDAFQA